MCVHIHSPTTHIHTYTHTHIHTQNPDMEARVIACKAIVSIASDLEHHFLQWMERTCGVFVRLLDYHMSVGNVHICVCVCVCVCVCDVRMEHNFFFFVCFFLFFCVCVCVCVFHTYTYTSIHTYVLAYIDRVVSSIVSDLECIIFFCSGCERMCVECLWGLLDYHMSVGTTHIHTHIQTYIHANYWIIVHYFFLVYSVCVWSLFFLCVGLVLDSYSYDSW